ncbi:hypothetical protein CVT26_015191 [Gymnopilus dilepis]|uniref:HMG box domain-containing protein n=1 Tax=Gymnopilus dilepis TaxID=231916 RepID=A0A409WQK4_9AGAR|nr:hypothetical protein CVT26_015191 [Gymnopilus dilepis]
MPAIRYGNGYGYADNFGWSGAAAAYDQRVTLPQAPNALRVAQANHDAAISHSLILNGAIAPGFPTVATTTVATFPRRSGFRYGSQHPYPDPRPLNATGGINSGRLPSQNDYGQHHPQQFIQNTPATAFVATPNGPNASFSAFASASPSFTRLHPHNYNKNQNQNQRRTAQRKGPNYIPSPRNSFMCFRSVYAGAHPNVRQQDLSRAAGAAWRAMKESDRQVYEDRAEAEKELHGVLFPVHSRSSNSNSSVRRKKGRGASPPFVASASAFASASTSLAGGSWLSCVPFRVSLDDSVEDRVIAFRAAQKVADACSLAGLAGAAAPPSSGFGDFGAPLDGVSPPAVPSARLVLGGEEETLESLLFTISPTSSPPHSDHFSYGTELEKLNDLSMTTNDTSAHDRQAILDPLPYSDPSLWLSPQDEVPIDVNVDNFNYFSDYPTPSSFACSPTESAASSPASSSSSSSSSSSLNQLNDPDLGSINNALSGLDLGYNFELDFDFDVLSNQVDFGLVNLENSEMVEVEGFDYAPSFDDEVKRWKGMARAV